MTNFVGYRDGGKTNEEGLMKWLSRGFTSGVPIGYAPTSFQVTQRGAGANMSVDVAIGDAHLVNPNGGYSFWAWSDAVNNVSITAADATNPRIDVIYAYLDLSVVSSASNNNPGALKFGVSTGTAAASPSANADSVIQTALGSTTPFIKLATILVGAAVSSITNAVITDIRSNISSNMPSATSTGADGWTASGETWTYATNDGQKQFTVTIAGDKTAKYSAGMRVKIPRSVTPPTQCMAFIAASSQYASKTTPAGITFTGGFTTESWAYLNSYTGAVGTMVARWSSGAVSGWAMQIDATGRLTCFYNNASGTTQYTTSQAIPLKRWMHLATVASGTTIIAYINGTSAPVVANTIAANTVVQAAVNLTVGGVATPGAYFDGYLSEVRVWSTNQSQSSIQANMCVSLTGSESNLVALFQGNGNFNDKTANANNLTANGGAVATQNASPLNATEYGIITGVSYSAPNTTLTIFCGTDYMVPNQTLGSPSWSMQRTPFGFPASRGKWQVLLLNKASEAQTNPTTSTWYNVGNVQVSLPIGEWLLSYNVALNITHAGSAFLLQYVTLSTGVSSEADKDFSSIGASLASSQSEVFGPVTKGKPVSVTTPQIYYLNTKSETGTTTGIRFRGDLSPTMLVAECAHI